MSLIHVSIYLVIWYNILTHYILPYILYSMVELIYLFTTLVYPSLREYIRLDIYLATKKTHLHARHCYFQFDPLYRKIV